MSNLEKIPEDTPDILGDIKWVYSNFSDLFHFTDDGQLVPNHKMIQQAPTKGSIAIAHYACEHPAAFIEKLVTRLMPKDSSVLPEETEDEIAERLDPTFKGIERYMMPDMPPDGEKKDEREGPAIADSGAA